MASILNWSTKFHNTWQVFHQNLLHSSWRWHYEFSGPEKEFQKHSFKKHSCLKPEDQEF